MCTHILMEYYSAIKAKMLIFVTTWMKLKDIILSAIKQTQKYEYDFISSVY